MTMIINGFEFKTTQDERMQHALLVRPATGGQWRVPCNNGLIEGVAPALPVEVIEV